MGHQVVLWEVTNFPKVKMKMLWFYVTMDPIQPFCATEISYLTPALSLEKLDSDASFGPVVP
jgi:hypothetical protein